LGTLHFGTSSWSEKSWVGPFYPPGTRPGDFLPVYATRFDTVEADNTYYAIPDERLVRGWAAKLPSGFRMAAKFPRSIVHAGEGPRPDPARVLVPEAVAEDTATFLERMRILGPKCGPLVLQFPFFNRTVFEHEQVFLARLDAYLGELPADFRYGVEVRNKAWLGEPLLEVLRRHRVALVCVEIAYMPHPARLAERMDLVTTDFAYVRLIGDRKAVEARTKTFDKLVLDQGRSLERWADLLTDFRDRVPETYVYANNHYAGHGPATIRDLAARLGQPLDSGG